MSPSRGRPSSRAGPHRPTGALPALAGQAELADRTLEGDVAARHAGNTTARRAAQAPTQHNPTRVRRPLWPTVYKEGQHHTSRLNRLMSAGAIGLLAAVAPVAVASAATPAPGAPGNPA